MTEKKAITNGTGLEEDSFIQEILICQESVHTQEIQGKKQTNKHLAFMGVYSPERRQTCQSMLGDQGKDRKCLREAFRESLTTKMTCE